MSLRRTDHNSLGVRKRPVNLKDHIIHMSVTCLEIHSHNIYILVKWLSFTGIACWLERRTRDRKVTSSNPDRSGRRIFSSRVNFVCWLFFGVRSTPVLLQWRVKDLGHSAKSAVGRLHLDTHTPLTQRSRSGLTMPLCRHSVEPIKKWAHTQLVRQHSATVISVRWATMDWSWPKEWNWCARANLCFKKWINK